MSENHYKYQFSGILVDHRRFDGKRVVNYMHSHNTYELLYFLTGDFVHGIEDRRYKLSKHDLVIVRPNHYHYIQINPTTPYERYDILFDPGELGIDNIHLLSEHIDVVRCQNQPMITDLFRKIDYYSQHLEGEDLRNVLVLLIKELFYLLSIREDVKNDLHPEGIHPIVSKALAEINHNLCSIKSIDEVADKLFVSKGYLFRMFKRELQTTPHKYIAEKRLNMAQNLLLQGQSPTQVYQACGFNDYTAFYRSYVKFFGCSPSQQTELHP